MKNEQIQKGVIVILKRLDGLIPVRITRVNQITVWVKRIDNRTAPFKVTTDFLLRHGVVAE